MSAGTQLILYQEIQLVQSLAFAVSEIDEELRQRMWTG